MRRTTKALLFFSILSLCFLGAIFSPKEIAKEREPKTQVMPVKNNQPHRPAGLRV